MKVVQVNRTDVTGGRFNTYNLISEFESRGVSPKYLVWSKTSADPHVKEMLHYPLSRPITKSLHEIETEMSRHAEWHPHSTFLKYDKDFAAADVVHYHIIHDGYFALPALTSLSRHKPSVWTWHDPWPMTGHCIYPMDCEKWKSGCGACPDLSLHFPMRDDRTKEVAAMKRKTVADADIDIVLASKYMLSMAQNSFVGSQARLHHIPFGIDLKTYRERNRDAVRERMGIPKENVVLCIRSFASTFKGLQHFIQALEMLQTTVPVTIIGFQEFGHFNRFLGRYQIIELGWVDDDEVMVDALSAADVFVMPSKAEAFGMMAAEAMACSKPVVVFEGTSLPEVVFAPDVGVAVPMGDSDALCVALRRLIESPDERRSRGVLSRKMAEKHYELGDYAGNLVSLYREVADRRLMGRVK